MRITTLNVFIHVIGGMILGISGVQAESIAAVLKSPKSYQSKKVELIGIVRGDVPYELYATSAGAVRMRSSEAIRIILPDGWNKRGSYDLRKVQVTGVIDASQHGTWGTNPCSLLLKGISILSGPAVPWPDVAVVFRNDSDKTVSLLLKTPPFSHNLDLARGQLEWKYTKTDGTVAVISQDGMSTATTKVIRHPDAPYYDAKNAAVYYRITASNNIEKVLPSIARSWGWRR